MTKDIFLFSRCWTTYIPVLVHIHVQHDPTSYSTQYRLLDLGSSFLYCTGMLTKTVQVELGRSFGFIVHYLTLL